MVRSLDKQLISLNLTLMSLKNMKTQLRGSTERPFLRRASLKDLLSSGVCLILSRTRRAELLMTKGMIFEKLKRSITRTQCFTEKLKEKDQSNKMKQSMKVQKSE